MTSVIIDDILPYTQVIASGGQTVFGTTWTADVASDVVVYQRANGISPDDRTQKLAPSAYTVSFTGAQRIVSITLLTPASSLDVITITRVTPVSRENLYTNTNFTPSMLNQDFGLVTLEIQENDLYNTQLTPRYNTNATINQNVDIILPILGANQIWAKDPANLGIIAVDLNEVISGGTVTDVNTGTGLVGGPITISGTISFAPIAAFSLWVNNTNATAVPAVTPLSTFLLSNNNLSDLTNAAQARTNLGLAIGTNVEAWSPKLDSLAGLSFVTNDLLFVASSTTLGLIAAANNSTLVTSNSGVPSLSQTLPQAVQTNIQYLGVQNQALDMGGFQIKDGASPTQPSDFATKSYVDQNSLTGTSVYAASAATLGTVTQSGSGVGATLTNAGAQATLALDGVNPPVGVNVLIKNTATGMTAANEGIYTVTNVGSGATNWVLTRATTYDTPAEINQTGIIVVQNGSTLAGTAWYNTNTIVTVDVTSLNYNQFGNIIFPVSLAHGGTNANLTAVNGGIVYSTATAFAISAAGTSGQLLQSAGSTTPVWTTNTYPSTDAKGDIHYASAANTISGLAIGSTGNMLTVAAGLPAWTTNTFPSTDAKGDILYASNTNTISGLAIGSTGNILTVAAGLPAWTTATYPSSTTINQILFSSASNVVGGITAANNGVLVSSNTGVPSWNTSLGQGLAVASSVLSVGGANNIPFNTTKGFQDNNGNLLQTFSVVASAVNFFTVQNNSTGLPVVVGASGSDGNVIFQVQGKGTGGVAIRGTGTNDNAASGFVGEYISSQIAFASRVNFSSGTNTDLTSISLTAGDWDVGGNFGVDFTGSATQAVLGWTNTTSATPPDPSLYSQTAPTTVTIALVPIRRYSFNTTTTVYLSGQVNFSGGVAGCFGYLWARRIR